MCGIAGFRGPTASREILESRCRAMASRLIHRGPDDEGVWVDPATGIALGHRRLSILDLSPAGHQPMASHCGRYVIAFNGEIYNHAELRGELAKAGRDPVWRGHSDTEVLLAAISAWGLDGALTRSRGMFAIALWDVTNRLLHLVRDRMGEKPLFYGRFGQTWLFGSELKALQAHAAWQGRIDRPALADFFRYSYIPTPQSIFQNVAKVPAGSYVTIGSDAGTERITRYWDLHQVVRQGLSRPLAATPNEAVDALERLLIAAVAEQSLADVPLGAFLSGGIDSSTIVALMQAGHTLPIRTFTIGFGDAQYDEAADARKVARHLGTDHTELRVESGDALDIVPRLPEIYDEPFADSSQIPTILVAALARSRVTVALSGDAGDELFGGYNRHLWVDRLWRRLRHLPQGARRGVARSLMRGTPTQWDTAFSMLGRLGLQRHIPRMPGEKVHKLAGILAAESPGAIYRSVVSQWQDPQRLVLGLPRDQPGLPVEIVPEMPDLGIIEAMMLRDTETYLPDDILAKVDRAAMATSLETRIPLLDRRIVEFAWQLPLSLKHRDGIGKWALRQVLYRHVPRELVDRPKTGFGVPIADWLRGPLREWAETLLDERQLGAQGYLDPRQVRSVWDEHMSGRRNLQHQLWPVLMFQAWRERWQA